MAQAKSLLLLPVSVWCLLVFGQMQGLITQNKEPETGYYLDVIYRHFIDYNKASYIIPFIF
jgi:hypothetical protein